MNSTGYYIGSNGASDNRNVIITEPTDQGSRFTEAYGGYTEVQNVPSKTIH